jgi:hypothetical protein
MEGTPGQDGLFVVVTEKEGIGALARAEDATERLVAAAVTDPLEADGALVQVVLAIIEVATDTFHGSCLDLRGV